jgi:hypothetical protein
MEVKFVRKGSGVCTVYPFDEMSKRMNGHGLFKSELNSKGECEGCYIYEYNSETKTKQLVSIINEALSLCNDDEFIEFLVIRNPETLEEKSFVWKPEEYRVFITNSEGKTVDRL